VEQTRMKIATFNANSIRSRIDAVTAWLAAHAPDVLCIQETKTADETFPREALEATGYHVVFKGEKAYNGVALISKAPPADVSFGIDDGGRADETRLVAATIGGVRIVNTYVPQGREIDHAMYKYKLEWFARLRAYFARHYTTKTKLVWLGDLNVAPEAMDIHNAEQQENHVCYHIDVRKAFADAVAWGFVDVFRKHHPEPQQYTFFDYRTPNAAKRKMGWRIDHILATPTLAAKSKDAFIDLAPRLQAKPSDHTFLAAEFDV
jgi:exodeoxyribonuclease III